MSKWDIQLYKKEYFKLCGTFLSSSNWKFWLCTGTPFAIAVVGTLFNPITCIVSNANVLAYLVILGVIWRVPCKQIRRGFKTFVTSFCYWPSNKQQKTICCCCRCKDAFESTKNTKKYTPVFISRFRIDLDSGSMGTYFKVSLTRKRITKWYLDLDSASVWPISGSF